MGDTSQNLKDSTRLAARELEKVLCAVCSSGTSLPTSICFGFPSFPKPHPAQSRRPRDTQPASVKPQAPSTTERQAILFSVRSFRAGRGWQRRQKGGEGG